MHLLLMIAQATPAVDPTAEGWVKLLISNFGVPGAFAIMLLFANYKGWIRPGREAEVYEKRLAEKDQTIAGIKAEYTARLEELRVDRDKYLGLLLRHQDVMERAVSAAERAADKAAAKTGA